MKSRIRHFFAIASAALLFARVASAAPSVDELVGKAKAFDRKFQANDALPLYLEAEKMAPKDPDLLVRIARQVGIVTDGDRTVRFACGSWSRDYR